MRALIVLVANCFLLTGISACGGSDKDRTQADTTENDTTVAAPPLPVIEHLADTAFASAAKMWYRIETVDSTIDGRIDNLADLYDGTGSVLTFRTDTRRNGVYGGILDSIPSQLVVEWTANTEVDRADTVFGPWGGGSGWTGQPLYVVWPDSAVRLLRDNGAVNGNFKGTEYIVGSLCGSVYFLDPASGKETRNTIATGNPIKGTVSLDPTFNGLLYVGHGTPAHRPFGAVTVNVFKNEVTDIFKEDPKALRRWGAYDSSAIRVGNFVFRPGENGGLYKFHIVGDTPRLQSVLRYKTNGVAAGVESSMAVYANYGYLADNRGGILAVNLDTMKPVWFYDLGDDTDATPVITEEDGIPYVYVGCEIDLQPRGHAVFAKLNALNGEEIWRIEPTGYRREDGKKHFDGGFYASPLVGRGDADGLLFTNMVKNTSGANGVFMAIDRKSGNIVYELPLKYYSWSSPVGFLTKEGKQIVLTADCAGNMYLIDALKGKIITTQRIGNNFESSPVAVGNAVVVGSRGNGIHKVSLR